MNSFQQMMEAQKASSKIEDSDIPDSFTEEQALAARLIKSGHNVCITGSAGVGKSFLLGYVIDFMRKKYGEKHVFVSASTGLAATHLDGGTTVHSLAGIGVDISDLNHCLKKAKRAPFWKNAKILFIDEISMLSPDYFAALNAIGKRIRNRSSLPFGGIQIVVLGDFLQLPYIDREYAEKRKKDPTLPKHPPALFDSKAWKETIKKVVLLTKGQRQKEPEFVGLLQRLRMGELTDADDELLKSRVRASLVDNGIQPTHIHTHKTNVGFENTFKLKDLKGEERVFEAEDGGPNKYAVETLQKNCMAPAKLVLKVGAQVMLLKNNQPPHLVNGSRGVVVGFRALSPGDPEFPDVEFESGITVNIGRKLWETKKGDVRLAFRSQVPLCLAWAITVHKCQGMTLDKVCIDISKCFERGQAYTGLSRCRTLEGMSLLGYNREAVKVDPRAVEWYAELGDVNAIRKDEELKEKEEEKRLKSAKKKQKQKGNQWWNEYE